MIVTMSIFTGEYITFTAVITTLLAIALTILIYKIKVNIKNKKTDKQISNEISIGFYLGVSNILGLIYVLLINNYIKY